MYPFCGIISWDFSIFDRLNEVSSNTPILSFNLYVNFQIYDLHVCFPQRSAHLSQPQGGGGQEDSWKEGAKTPLTIIDSWEKSPEKVKKIPEERFTKW